MSLTLDAERNILYGLTLNSEIQVWVIENQEQKLRLAFTKQNVFSDISGLAGNNVVGVIGTGIRIVNLCVIGSEEAERAVLVAILNTGESQVHVPCSNAKQYADLVIPAVSFWPPGARIYFTHGDRQSTFPGRLPPTQLNAFHAKTPMSDKKPEESGLNPIIMSKTLPTSVCLSGVYIAVVGDTSETSRNFIFHGLNSVRALRNGSNDGTYIGGTLPEIVQLPTVSNEANWRVSAIAEGPTPLSKARYLPSTSKFPSPSTFRLSDHVTQVTVPEYREFLILAGSSLQIWRKSRPCDVVEDLASRGARELFTRYAHQLVMFLRVCTVS